MAQKTPRTKYPQIGDYYVGNVKEQGVMTRPFEGLVTVLTDPKKVKPGAYVSGKNWITGQLQDHMELRGGTKLIGTGISGAGKVTGLGVGIRKDGTQIMFRSRGRKVEYCVLSSTGAVTTDWTEVGTNLLPAAASGEDISFQFYNGLAGAMEYLSSPNSSIYKIPLANPGNAVDQSSTTFRGTFIISGNRSILWNRKTLATGFTDKTGINLSYVDQALLSAFTTVTAESYGTGDGNTKTFTHTAGAMSGARTIFGATVTDGTETFLDDGSGNFVGSLGGTGTINYATGAMSVTFHTAPTLSAAITTTYQWEDATSKGVCDFSFTTPARKTGEGDYFRQDDGGQALSVLPFDSKYYCLHILKSWVLSNLSPDDTQATNLPWRDNVGIPYWRAAFANGEGITLLDYTNRNNPRVRRLGYNQLGVVEPIELSETLSLSPYEFDYAVMFEYDNYDLLCCQKKTLGVADGFNSVMFIRNKVSGVWDILEYSVSVLAAYLGMLLAGDFVSNNVYQLFSGYDDEGYLIDNSLTFGQMNLGVPGIKKTKRFEVDTFIGPSQVLEVWLAYDSASAVKVGEIRGDGSYVDINNGTVIGGGGIGSDVVGSSGVPNAFHAGREFTIASDRYEQVQPTFKATGIGPVAINYFGFKDNRYKGRRKLPQYDS